MKNSQYSDTVPGVLVSTDPAGEADMLVRFFGPDHGGFMVRARGFRKAASKLSPQLQPASELQLSIVAGRGASRMLTGISIHRDHPAWRNDLHLLALYWYFAECAATSSAEDETNTSIYQLLVNLLRNPPDPGNRHSCAAVFCLKLARLNGLLPDLQHCAIDSQRLADDEPTFIMPGFEGLVGREAYNRLYARTGGGLMRLDPGRRRCWTGLLGSSLLDYPAAKAEATDSAMLVHQTTRGIADLAGKAVRSADFLLRQWKLPSYAELIHGQEQ